MNKYNTLIKILTYLMLIVVAGIVAGILITEQIETIPNNKNTQEQYREEYKLGIQAKEHNIPANANPYVFQNQRLRFFKGYLQQSISERK